MPRPCDRGRRRTWDHGARAAACLAWLGPLALQDGGSGDERYRPPSGLIDNIRNGGWRADWLDCPRACPTGHRRVGWFQYFLSWSRCSVLRVPRQGSLRSAESPRGGFVRITTRVACRWWCAVHLRTCVAQSRWLRPPVCRWMGRGRRIVAARLRIPKQAILVAWALAPLAPKGEARLVARHRSVLPPVSTASVLVGGPGAQNRRL